MRSARVTLLSIPPDSANLHRKVSKSGENLDSSAGIEQTRRKRVNLGTAGGPHPAPKIVRAYPPGIPKIQLFRTSAAASDFLSRMLSSGSRPRRCQAGTSERACSGVRHVSPVFARPIHSPANTPDDLDACHNEKTPRAASTADVAPAPAGRLSFPVRERRAGRRDSGADPGSGRHPSPGEPAGSGGYEGQSVGLQDFVHRLEPGLAAALQLPKPPEVTPWAWPPVTNEPPESPRSAHALVCVAS